MDQFSSRTSCLPSSLFTVCSKLDRLFSFPPIFFGWEIAHLDSDHCVSTADAKAAFPCNLHRGLNPRRCIRHLPPPQSSPSDAPLLISPSDAKTGSAPGSKSATENVLISDAFCQLGNIWLDVFRLSTTHIVKLEQVMMPAVREICKLVGR